MKVCLFLSLLILVSCSEKNKVPKGILPPQKMEVVLWDLIRADEFVLNYIVKDTSRNRKLESIKLYEQVFTIHGINKGKFQKSFLFYEKHPELLQPLMDTLEKRQKREGARIMHPSFSDTLRKQAIPRIKNQ